MGRMQLFEIQDQSWCPESARDAITDHLRFGLNLWNQYAPIVPRLRDAMKRAGTRRVLDLCSGGGGPWLRLHRTFEQNGFPLEICLTDKYPNTAAFLRARSESGNNIEFREDPVDALRIPAGLDGFRTFFSSFHHFPPEEARAILRDAVESRQGIAVFEATRRDLRAMLIMIFLAPVMTLIFAPFIRPFRWSRLLWTYLIPIVPVAAVFDGLVSCARTYSPSDLRELTDGLDQSAYAWDIGEQGGAAVPVPITYLIGSRKPV